MKKSMTLVEAAVLRNEIHARYSASDLSAMVVSLLGVCQMVLDEAQYENLLFQVRNTDSAAGPLASRAKPEVC